MPKGGAREGTGPKRRCTEQCQFSHRLAEWQALCGRAITNMVCCGFCGYVALGNANLKQWTQLPIASLSATLQPAPYAIMNGFMAHHVMRSPSTFHVCPVCKNKHARAKRALHTVLMDPLLAWQWHRVPRRAERPIITHRMHAGKQKYFLRKRGLILDDSTLTKDAASVLASTAYSNGIRVITLDKLHFNIALESIWVLPPNRPALLPRASRTP